MDMKQGKPTSFHKYVKNVNNISQSLKDQFDSISSWEQLGRWYVRKMPALNQLFLRHIFINYHRRAKKIQQQGDLVYYQKWMTELPNQANCKLFEAQKQKKGLQRLQKLNKCQQINGQMNKQHKKKQNEAVQLDENRFKGKKQEKNTKFITICDVRNI